MKLRILVLAGDTRQVEYYRYLREKELKYVEAVFEGIRRDASNLRGIKGTDYEIHLYGTWDRLPFAQVVEVLDDIQHLMIGKVRVFMNDSKANLVEVKDIKKLWPF